MMMIVMMMMMMMIVMMDIHTCYHAIHVESNSPGMDGGETNTNTRA